MTKKCNHVSKIVKFGYRLVDGQMDSAVDLYGCTKCDKTSKKPLYNINEEFAAPDHSNCAEYPCFGCKAKSLQLSTGDANGKRIMSSGAFDRELNSYYSATAQGIEPISTKQKDIDAAVRVSNDTGVAFDANKI